MRHRDLAEIHWFRLSTRPVVREIAKQSEIAKALSAQTFADGILRTVGSAEWRALLVAAKSD